MKRLLMRLYRFFLVLVSAFVGGLLAYWLVWDQAQQLDENVAALLSWVLIFLCGYVAHRLLPKDDLSRVSRILLAILASVTASMATAWLFVVLLDIPFDFGFGGPYIIVGVSTLILACAVFFPLYLFREKIGRYQTATYFSVGALIPFLWIYFTLPFDSQDPMYNVMVAAVFGAIGAAAAAAFRLVAGHHEVEMTDMP